MGIPSMGHLEVVVVVVEHPFLLPPTKLSGIILWPTRIKKQRGKTWN